jgi:hypothetical protein
MADDQCCRLCTPRWKNAESRSIIGYEQRFKIGRSFFLPALRDGLRDEPARTAGAVFRGLSLRQVRRSGP